MDVSNKLNTLARAHKEGSDWVANTGQGVLENSKANFDEYLSKTHPIYQLLDSILGGRHSLRPLVLGFRASLIIILFLYGQGSLMTILKILMLILMLSLMLSLMLILMLILILNLMLSLMLSLMLNLMPNLMIILILMILNLLLNL
jgi:hypothetical protein